MGSDRTPWRTGTRGNDVIDQVGRRLGHAPGPARRAKAAPLAAEGDQLVVAAVATAQAQEAVGQDAAFEKGVELVPDELRQAGASGLHGLGEEGLGVLLHQAVQGGVFGPVAVVVDLGAIGYPVGKTVGLHELLPSL